MKIYAKPVGLLWGDDARSAVAGGCATWLAGGPAAFSGCVVRTRESAPELVACPDLSARIPGDLLERLTGGRASFIPKAGLRTAIMGIVNVTPDSFSDGGLLQSSEAAIAHGRALVNEGADCLDIGGESTRPGARDVAYTEELSRIIPVIEGLADVPVPLSVDTRKAAVMAAALDAGATIVNDVSALTYDAQSLAMVAARTCPVILMHSQGTPATMQLAPSYGDVVLDVYDALESRLAACEAAGIARTRLIIDPGIGFGKTLTHNLHLLRDLALFHGLGVAMLVGVSRKGFIGTLGGQTVAACRVSGSVAGALHAAACGVHIVRVHDVAATAEAFRVADALLDPVAIEAHTSTMTIPGAHP